VLVRTPAPSKSILHRKCLTFSDEKSLKFVARNWSKWVYVQRR